MLKLSLRAIKDRLSRSMFITTPISIFINPCFIARDGIYRNILCNADAISGKVLDIGCGSKPYEQLFRNVESYIGVDVENSGHDHVNIKVDFFYDGKTLPFGDEEFDNVICFEVLEHVFDINDLLREAQRVLKPGGLMLISIPFAWEEHEIPYDFARYTSYGLTHIINSNGFKVLQLSKTTTYALAICQIFIVYLFSYCFPRCSLARGFALLLVFPLNVLAFVLDSVLPKQYKYFCNCVVLAEK